MTIKRLPVLAFGVILATGLGSGLAASASDTPHVPADQAVAMATTTTLLLNSPTVTYGDEQTEQASVSVTGSSPDSTSVTLPSGIVDVMAGTTEICSVTLDAGAGSCAFPPAAVPGAHPKLTASYQGDPLNASSVSAPVPLTVLKESSKTLMTVSPVKITYSGQDVHLSVSVQPQYGGIAEGKVYFGVGSAKPYLCPITLKSGTGTCTLRRGAIPAGIQHLTAAYSGSASINGSTAASTAITVLKEPTKMKLRLLGGSKIVYGHEQFETVWFYINALYGGDAWGKVTVKAGTRVLCTVIGKNICKLSSKQLRPGSYNIKAYFTGTSKLPGSTNFAASKSMTKRLTVTAP